LEPAMRETSSNRIGGRTRMRLALPGLLAAFILSMNAGAGWSQEEDDLLTFNSYCRQCHVTNEGDHRLGPSLYGIVGKEVGSQEGFNYSSAMANSDLVWDEETLDAFLEQPDETLPGHNMKPFAGVPSAEERAKIIAYLKAESED